MSETAVVTMLFTGVVGSTELSQALGEDASEELRRTHFALLREAIEADGGEKVKNLGDGIMAVFSSPSEALASAVAMQQGVARHNRRARHPLGVRVGLHVGEVTRDEEDYSGTAVVVAQRVCGSAGGGEIVVSDVFRVLAWFARPFVPTRSTTTRPCSFAGDPSATDRPRCRLRRAPSASPRSSQRTAWRQGTIASAGQAVNCPMSDRRLGGGHEVRGVR